MPHTVRQRLLGPFKEISTRSSLPGFTQMGIVCSERTSAPSHYLLQIELYRAHNFLCPVRLTWLLIQETILRPQATRTRVIEDRRRIQTSNNYRAFIEASHPFSDIASLCKALTGSMGCCDLSFFGSGLTCRTDQTGKPDRPLSRITFSFRVKAPEGYITSISIYPPAGRRGS